MERLLRPVGVFDSGIGGISVLAEALRLLPFENYVYYGDHLHVPYGDKQPGEVLALTRTAVEKLVGMGCKAIILACNTATSAAASTLRQELDMPIIGMEPALKPASELAGDGDVLVMATQMTLSQPKFRRLMQRYGKNAVEVPCPGLMEYVESEQLSGEAITAELQALLFSHIGKPMKAAVLGCTHYVFLRQAIRATLGEKIPLLDGNRGTVLQLERRLREQNLLCSEDKHGGNVDFYTSAVDEGETLKKMERMLRVALEQNEIPS